MLGRVDTRQTGAGTVKTLYDSATGDPVDERHVETAQVVVHRSFDRLGRLESARYANPQLTVVAAPNRPVTTSLTYDGAGRVASETVSAAWGSRTTASTWTLSSASRWQRQVSSPASTWVESFDQVGRLASKSHAGAGAAGQVNFSWLGNLEAGRTYTPLAGTSPFARGSTFDGFGQGVRVETRVVETANTPPLFEQAGCAR